MNTKYSILLTLILLTNIVIAQNWEHYYGQANVYNSSRDVEEAYDKGYLLLGKNYFEGNPEWISQSWLIKTDINGELLWDKILINNDQFVQGNAMDKCNDGGTLICGSLHNNNNSYPFITKLNACGEKEWCHRIPGAQNDLPWAEDIKELPNGNIVMLVNMFGDGTYESMHLFMINSIGQILWQNPYCSGLEHETLRPLGESIQITSDNKIIICGSSYWKNPWEPGSEYYWIRPTFTKVDPETGDEEWVLPFGLQDTIVGDAYHFVQKEDGNYIGFASDWTDDNYVHPLFIEFNDDGNLINYKQIHSSEIDPSFQESHFEDGFIIDSSLYLIGLGGGDGEFPVINVVIDTNIFSNKPNISNTMIHDNIYWRIFIKKTFDNKIINAATFQEPGNWDIYLTKLNLNLEQDSIYTAPYTYDSLCPDPILSGFISLDGCYPVSIEEEEIPTPQEYYSHIASIPIKIYPNPASNIVHFAMENTEHHSNITLQVYDIYGKLIHEQNIITGQQEAVTDVSFWESGMYAVVISSNSKIVGKSNFIVK